MKPRILYTKPSITELEVRYATDAAANGWGDRCYAYINRFEELFKQHLGVNYAIATSSCTGALHMGMAALGIGPDDPDDEVQQQSVELNSVEISILTANPRPRVS